MEDTSDSLQFQPMDASYSLEDQQYFQMNSPISFADLLVYDNCSFQNQSCFGLPSSKLGHKKLDDSHTTDSLGDTEQTPVENEQLKINEPRDSAEGLCVTTVKGHSTQGHSTQGHIAQCHSTQCHTTQGHSTQGHSTQGHTTQGHSINGQSTQGQSTQGHPTKGHSTQGHSTQGHSTQGHLTQGHTTQGHSTQGHSTQGHSAQSILPSACSLKGASPLRKPSGDQTASENLTLRVSITMPPGMKLNDIHRKESSSEHRHRIDKAEIRTDAHSLLNDGMKESLEGSSGVGDTANADAANLISSPVSELMPISNVNNNKESHAICNDKHRKFRNKTSQELNGKLALKPSRLASCLTRRRFNVDRIFGCDVPSPVAYASSESMSVEGQLTVTPVSFTDDVFNSHDACFQLNDVQHLSNVQECEQARTTVIKQPQAKSETGARSLPADFGKSVDIPPTSCTTEPSGLKQCSRTEQDSASSCSGPPSGEYHKTFTQFRNYPASPSSEWFSVNIQSPSTDIPSLASVQSTVYTESSPSSPGMESSYDDSTTSSECFDDMDDAAPSPYVMTPGPVVRSDCRPFNVHAKPSSPSNIIAQEQIPIQALKNENRAKTTKGGSRHTRGKDKVKRLRTAFSAQQLVYLEDYFNTNQYLNRTPRAVLALTLNLSERQIKIWFQNRRMKAKKDRHCGQASDRDPTDISTCASNSTTDSPALRSIGDSSLHVNGSSSENRPSSERNVVRINNCSSDATDLPDNTNSRSDTQRSPRAADNALGKNATNYRSTTERVASRNSQESHDESRLLIRSTRTAYSQGSLEHPSCRYNRVRTNTPVPPDIGVYYNHGVPYNHGIPYNHGVPYYPEVPYNPAYEWSRNRDSTYIQNFNLHLNTFIDNRSSRSYSDSQQTVNNFPSIYPFDNQLQTRQVAARGMPLPYKAMARTDEYHRFHEQFDQSYGHQYNVVANRFNANVPSGVYYYY